MKNVFLLAVNVTALAFFGVFLAGCGDASKPSAAAPAAEQKEAGKKTAAQALIEDVTGKTAVDQGLSAKNRLRAIDLERRKDMEALDK